MKLPNISLDKYLKTHKTLILFSVFLIVVFGEFFLSIYEHLPFTFNDILKYTYGYFIYALITKMEVLSEKIDNLGDVNDLRTRVTTLEKQVEGSAHLIRDVNDLRTRIAVLEKQNKTLVTTIIAKRENLNGLSDIIKTVIQEHLNEMLNSDNPDATAL